MNRLIEFLVGLLFGFGLILSGMTDPGKVIGFLDVAGTWDPSLALVMGGAVIVGLFAFAVARKRTTTFLGSAMHLPNREDIDQRLLIGALVFGAGWGLAGFCPMTAAMLAGMAVHELSSRPAQNGVVLE